MQYTNKRLNQDVTHGQTQQKLLMQGQQPTVIQFCLWYK